MLLHCLAGLYALGKESLLLELAMEFKTWIEVSFERMETLRTLELPDVFTTDQGAGRVRVVEQSEISAATLHKWNKDQPTLAILPTSRPLVSLHPNIHVVPYSDHSSYQELEDFVSALKPTIVIPIVGNHVPGSLSALVPSRKRHEILVPESVQHYMLRHAESQPSSSVYTSRRYIQPIAPKGVIFESPVRAFNKPSKETWEAHYLEQNVSEDEMDTESCEKDADCIFVDLSKDLVPENHRGGHTGDMWSLNFVKAVSENEAMTKSVPLSQLNQSDFAPEEVVTNTKGSSTPVRAVKRPLQTKPIKETPISCTSQQKRHGGAQKNRTLSDSDGMSQQSTDGIDHDTDIVSNDGTSQHDEHDQNHKAQSNLDNQACILSSPLRILRQEYVEELENSILKDLPFTEMEQRMCGLLQHSFVRQFPLCPIRDPNDEDFSDRWCDMTFSCWPCFRGLFVRNNEDKRTFQYLEPFSLMSFSFSVPQFCVRSSLELWIPDLQSMD